MSNHEQDQSCATLIGKLTRGEHLNAAEKSHLSQCDDCMREIVLQLDEMAEVSAPLERTRESADADLPQPNPELIEALENGRRKLARKFGL